MRPYKQKYAKETFHFYRVEMTNMPFQSHKYKQRQPEIARPKKPDGLGLSQSPSPTSGGPARGPHYSYHIYVNYKQILSHFIGINVYEIQ